MIEFTLYTLNLLKETCKIGLHLILYVDNDMAQLLELLTHEGKDQDRSFHMSNAMAADELGT